MYLHKHIVTNKDTCHKANKQETDLAQSSHSGQRKQHVQGPCGEQKVSFLELPERVQNGKCEQEEFGGRWEPRCAQELHFLDPHRPE